MRDAPKPKCSYATCTSKAEINGVCKWHWENVVTKFEKVQPSTATIDYAEEAVRRACILSWLKKEPTELK